MFDPNPGLDQHLIQWKVNTLQRQQSEILGRENPEEAVTHGRLLRLDHGSSLFGQAQRIPQPLRPVVEQAMIK